MYSIKSIPELERESDYFLSKVKGALMYKGGSESAIEGSFEDVVLSCFKNGIILDACLMSDKIVDEMNRVRELASTIIGEEKCISTLKKQ